MARYTVYVCHGVCPIWLGILYTPVRVLVQDGSVYCIRLFRLSVQDGPVYCIVYVYVYWSRICRSRNVRVSVVHDGSIYCILYTPVRVSDQDGIVLYCIVLRIVVASKSVLLTTVSKQRYHADDLAARGRISLYIKMQSDIVQSKNKHKSDVFHANCFHE